MIEIIANIIAIIFYISVTVNLYQVGRELTQRKKDQDAANNRFDGHERVMMTLRRDHEALVKEMQKMKCRVGHVKAKLERNA